MFKKNFILVLLFVSHFSFSQVMVSSFPLKLKNNRDVFQIVNDSTLQTTLFISDRKKVLAFLLDEKSEIIDSISTDRPERKYADIIGFSGEKTNPRLFWSTAGHTELYSQFYDLKNNAVSNLDYKLDLKYERFIEVFSENKKLYLLTFVKKTDLLKLYVFDEDGKLDVKNIDFSSFKFANSKSDYGSISEALVKTVGEFNTFEETFTLAKISTESPTSLSESAKKRKCYSNDKQIIITFDFNDKVTELITIDLNTYLPTLTEISKPKLNLVNSSDDINSNSFLYDDKLFQFCLTPYKMVLTIKDLNGNLIKEYSANDSEDTKFKNSDFLRQNHMGSERELETTEQFLRKVARSNVGISVYDLNGKYLITMGSVSAERKNNGGGIGMMAPMGGFPMNGGMMMPMGGFYMGMSVSPIYGKLNSYTNRRVISFDSLLDKDFNHTKGEIPDLAFDKMQKFVTKYYQMTSETVYRLKGDYYLGYYDSMAKSYILQKFTD